MVLASLDDTLSLEELATRAERKTEADFVSRSVSEVASSIETSECEINRLRANMVDLKKMLSNFASAKKPVNRAQQTPLRVEDLVHHLCWYLW